MENRTDNENIENTKIFITTRESGSSVELDLLLRSAGYELLEWPMIETTAVNLNNESKNILDDLNIFEWFVFTSARGVSYFFEYLDGKGKDISIIKTKKIAVIGKKTAHKLQEYGFREEYLARGNNSELFVKELAILFKNTLPNVLFPTGNLTGDTLEKGLLDMGRVFRINMYKTSQPVQIDNHILELIIEGRYNIIYFFSPSAVKNFKHILGEDVDIDKIRAACIGPTTQKACVDIGITPIFTAEKPDSQHMFKQTMDYLDNIGTKK